MASSGGSRVVSVRLSVGELAVLEGLAGVAGVGLGALVREAALRGAGGVVRDVVEGGLVLRRANGSVGSRVSALGPVVPAGGRLVSGVAVSGPERVEAFRRATSRG